MRRKARAVTAPGRVRIPVVLHSEDEARSIAAAADRIGVSRSEYMRRAAIEAARQAPPEQPLRIAIDATRKLVRRINDMADDLHQALDSISDAARIPASEEY